MKNFFQLFFYACIGLIMICCTPEEKSESNGIDIQLDLTEAVFLDAEATSIEFKVLNGKTAKQSDLFFLDGPAGKKSCRIISVSSSKITVELYSDFQNGIHKVSVQRGLESVELGSVMITKEESEEDIKPSTGSSVYGQVSCNGRGVPNVVVSDGKEVTSTDKNGVYQLKSSKKFGFVFISTPSGYNVALDGVIPQFYKSTTKSASAVERIDFNLTVAPDQSSFNYLVFGDMHMANRHNDKKQFPRFVNDVKQYMEEHPGELFYAATLGDMSDSRYWIKNNYTIPNYLKDIEQLNGLPIYHTSGNHDHSEDIFVDFDALSEYRKHIGPAFYSYNIGKIHCVVLDNIEIRSSGYNCHVIQEHLEWLKKDLSYVPEDTPIFIHFHAPLYKNPRGTQNVIIRDNTSTLLELESILDEYDQVHIFSAHTHVIYHIDNGNIQEHNSGAVCAAWWASGYLSSGLNLAKDGAPGGYNIVKVDGKNVQWQYKGTDYSINEQFATYDRNQIDLSSSKRVPLAKESHRAEYEKEVAYWLKDHAENEVYINVWNYDPSWSIEVHEAGKALDVTRVFTQDPLYALSTIAKRQNTNKSSDGTTSYNLFKVVASSPNSTLNITVTDRFGNVYTENMKRPKEFEISTYKRY